jgi:hypothetical protein
LLQALHGAFQLLEDRLGGAVQGAAGAGQENGPVAALEQLYAKAFLKQAYLAADGAVGDVQLFGGARSFRCGRRCRSNGRRLVGQFHVLSCAGASRARSHKASVVQKNYQIYAL